MVNVVWGNSNHSWTDLAAVGAGARLGGVVVPDLDNRGSGANGQNPWCQP
jgi:hypothetical protein